MSNAGGVRRFSLPALVALMVLVGAACDVARGGLEPSAAQSFRISESGGMDGRMNTLLVRPDGVAVLMCPRSRGRTAGSWSTGPKSARW